MFFFFYFTFSKPGKCFFILLKPYFYEGREKSNKNDRLQGCIGLQTSTVYSTFTKINGFAEMCKLWRRGVNIRFVRGEILFMMV